VLLAGVFVSLLSVVCFLVRAVVTGSL